MYVLFLAIVVYSQKSLCLDYYYIPLCTSCHQFIESFQKIQSSIAPCPIRIDNTFSADSTQCQPKLFGGDGLSPIGGMGITTPNQAVLLSAPTVTRLGQDLLLEYTRKESC